MTPMFSFGVWKHNKVQTQTKDTCLALSTSLPGSWRSQTEPKNELMLQRGVLYRTNLLGGERRHSCIHVEPSSFAKVSLAVQLPHGRLKSRAGAEAWGTSGLVLNSTYIYIYIHIYIHNMDPHDAHPLLDFACDALGSRSLAQSAQLCLIYMRARG